MFRFFGILNSTNPFNIQQHTAEETAQTDSPDSSTHPEPSNIEIYKPSPTDISTVSKLLMKGSSQSPPLPYELAELILDLAEYWCQAFIETTDPISGMNMNTIYLSFATLPTLHLTSFRQCERIEFEVYAHDQGWATAEGSWTWAETVLTSNCDGSVDDEICERVEVYRNPCKNSQWQRHVKRFERDCKIVNGFVPGETQVRLILRSCFSGWIHFAQKARITMHYSIKPTL